MRATLSTAQIAESLLATDGPIWGYQLRKKLRIPSGVLYPVLARMVREQWLVREREEPVPEDRPARWYYQVTDAGREALAELVERRKRYG